MLFLSIVFELNTDLFKNEFEVLRIIFKNIYSVYKLIYTNNTFIGI